MSEALSALLAQLAGSSAVSAKAVIEQWVQLECDDYLLCVGLISGMLYHAEENSPPEWKIGQRSAWRVVAELIERSPLGQLFEVDRSQNVVRFREDVSVSERSIAWNWVLKFTSTTS